MISSTSGEGFGLPLSSLVAMLGISYGELFLILGATAALVGPKDLPKIARTAGRLAGRAIGYVQVARGQFASVMQQSQASQVHKELQDTIAQLEAIRYEIRSISIMNPGPFTRRLDGAPLLSNNAPDIGFAEKPDGECTPTVTNRKDFNSMDTISSNMHSQATTFARLAEAQTMRSYSFKGSGDEEKLNEDGGLLNVLPISAESARLLPKQNGDARGSDIVLEAIMEAEVARNAKQFCSKLESELPKQ